MTPPKFHMLALLCVAAACVSDASDSQTGLAAAGTAAGPSSAPTSSAGGAAPTARRPTAAPAATSSSAGSRAIVPASAGTLAAQSSNVGAVAGVPAANGGNAGGGGGSGSAPRPAVAAGSAAPAAASGDTMLPCAVSRALDNACHRCHGATPVNGAPMSLVVLDDFRHDSGRPPLPIYQRALKRVDGSASPVMPPGGMITDADKKTLIDWLSAGAPAANSGTAACL